jgi:metallo-beta-lactamase family protein
LANIKRSYVHSLGKSTDDVTGSCFELVTPKSRILIDFGLRQSSDDVLDYKANLDTIKSVKVKKIDACLCLHAHQDHLSLVPCLYRSNFDGVTYLPENTKDIAKLMWMDSAKIQMQNQQMLQKKGNISGNPFYNQEDIEVTYNHIVECEFNKIIQITEDVSFELRSSNHLVNAAQALIYVNTGNATKALAYCCDLGSLTWDNYYINNFEPIEKADIAIVESTYATDRKGNARKNRDKDIEKIKALVENMYEERGRIIIPTFSLGRSADLLTVLYETFADDPDFNIPVVFDAVLGNQINENYDKWIPKNHGLWNKVWSWKNLVKVKDWNESVQWQNYTAPCVILGSGGFIQGRSTAYIKHWLSDPHTTILFCGFSGADSRSKGYQIQHNKEYPIVDLDGYKVKNNAKIVSLKSFSSHISHEEMLEYYSNMNCNKIYLVHGSKERKEAFKPLLEDEISKKNKTSKVVIPDSETKMYL